MDGFSSIQALVSSPYQSHPSWCLLSSTWWIQFQKNYTSRNLQGGISSSFDWKEPISNEALLENGILKMGLVLDEDYVLLPEEAYDQLFSWFGGGPKIVRRMITLHAIEVYPLWFKVELPESDDGTPIEVQEIRDMSKSDTVLDLKKKISEKFNLKMEAFTLYYKKNGEDVIFSSNSATLFQYGLHPGQKIYVENIPLLGLTGLDNLGNTCYMNAALQCLSNVELLTQFIINGSFRTEVNTNNKITQGKIGLGYASLILRMWKGKSSIAPKEFKQIAGKIDSRWEGFQQQDAHEFLQFLLNCLNDDFNRIKERPPHVDIDEKNKTESEIAHEFWELEKRRDKSFITDLFRGLFKSQLHCPTCNKIYNKFETFFDISIQIPSKNSINFTVFYLPPIGQKPIRFLVTMRPTATIRELKNQIFEKIKGPEVTSDRNILIAEVFDDNFSKIFTNDSETLSAINPKDNIYAYSLSPPMIPVPSDSPSNPPFFAPFSGSPLQCVTLPVLQRSSFPVLSSNKRQYIFKPSLVATPFVLTLPRKLKYWELYEILKLRVGDLVKITDKSMEEGKQNMMDKEKLERFCIWKVDKSGMEGEKILEIDDQYVTLNEKICLAIEWNIKGFQLNQFSRIKPEIALEISTVNNDEEQLTLSDCVADFIKAEKLSEEEAWYCPECKDHKQAVKKIDLWKTPPILIFHLKRFQTRGFWSGKKISKLCVCPDTFDMTSVVKEIHPNSPPLYELFGVVNHYGLSAHGGHYTAACKNPNSDMWYYFDDNKIQKMDSNPVTGAAYILFYKLKTMTQ